MRVPLDVFCEVELVPLVESGVEEETLERVDGAAQNGHINRTWTQKMSIVYTKRTITRTVVQAITPS